MGDPRRLGRHRVRLADLHGHRVRGLPRLRRGHLQALGRAAWTDKLAAGFTNSASKSGDKLHTLQFFQILAAQLGMHWVNLGLLPGWNSSAGSEHDINRLGFFAGAAAQTNADQGPDAVHKADVATAEHLGRRVTETAKTFALGRAAIAA